jgi:hypothetical protein
LSASGFARLNGVKASDVAYHFRCLARDGLITLTHTTGRKTVESFYSLTAAGASAARRSRRASMNAKP